MRLDSLKYTKLVKGVYQSKKEKNELSNSLIHPTYTKIKKECLAVYKKRPDKKDEKALNDFFEVEGKEINYLQLLKAAHVYRFRALDNYIKGDTDNTDHTNVELLAWLIDFRHRPHVLGHDVELNDEDRRVSTPVPW